MLSNDLADRLVQRRALLEQVSAFLKDYVAIDWPMAAIHFSVEPALMLEQAFYGIDQDGKIDSLLTWGFLDEALNAQFASGASRVLHPGEWTEGLNLWLIHIYCPLPHPPRTFRRKVKALALEYGAVRWIVWRRDSPWICEVSQTPAGLAFSKIEVNRANG